ncbi:MAG: metal-sulfur cluster assembly factor [Gammaproteobacteria bacterium]|nr:metal-sulfur cluster assembly factor [Gammaproteobacteria bacterium]
MNQKTDSPVEQAVWEALAEVMDHEVGVNIVDLGLVYKVAVTDAQADVEITMTSPSCPIHVMMANEARQSILRRVPTLSAAEVRVVWDPPWTPELMSEKAKKILGR